MPVPAMYMYVWLTLDRRKIRAAEQRFAIGITR